MTDPRIEAAAHELNRLFSEGEQANDAMWLSCAECILAAADAVAWRPMSEAPSDGTRFWAWFPLRNNVFSIRWAFNIYDEKDNWTLDDDESACLTHDNPTHWQPLPAPPKAQNT